MAMIRFFSATIIFMLIAGCGSKPPIYYMLHADSKMPSGGALAIGLGPVTLAEYINPRSLVLQTSPYKIEVAANHRWAGDLDQSITRVMCVNLGARLETENVQAYPWKNDGDLNYQVTIDFREFVAGADGYARIEAVWRVYSLPISRLVLSKNFIDKEPILKADFEKVVSAKSVLLGRLSEDISRGIRGR